jgi:prolyl-tRNA synthetase
MMQDRKALQAGTSHYLGQNFAKASNIRYQTADEKEDFAWTTSWGASTRLIGGLIMTHGDDDGLAVPPKVAPTHVVILPIAHKPDDRQKVMDYCDQLAQALRRQYYHHRPLVVEIDDRDIGGARGWEWIKKGVPLRLEIGPRDMANDAVFMARRDQGPKGKESMPREQFIVQVGDILDDIQASLFQRANAFRLAHTHELNEKADFYDFFTPRDVDKPEIHGGFALSHWCGSAQCESKIKEDLTVTIRCLPIEGEKVAGPCICCGVASQQRVVFAKAY